MLQTQQWLWYYCPVALYVLFLLVLGVADFVEGAALEAPADGGLTKALAPVVVILFAPLLVALTLQTRSFLDPDVRSIEIANRDAGQWIAANLPEDSVLASWDAGVIGYYAGRPVINLDGVANSVAYYDAGRDGTVGDFLAERGLTGIVNHGTPVDGRDPEIDGFIRSLWGPGADALGDGHQDVAVHVHRERGRQRRQRIGIRPGRLPLRGDASTSCRLTSTRSTELDAVAALHHRPPGPT